jgi:AcrR family transcriptional regulator
MVENATNLTKISVTTERNLTIGQLTEAVTNLTGKRCTAAMIYNYERQELLETPERSPGGFRLFRPVDVVLVTQIKRWQEKGLSLGEIKEKLANNGDSLDEDLRIQDLFVNRKSQILEAAGGVFLQKGYSETTLQDIAQAASVSTASIYQYFDSKENLFLCLIDNLSFLDVMEEITSPLELSSHTTFEDIRSSLIKVANAFLDTHHPNADVMRMFVCEVRRFPEIGESYCQRLIAPIEARLEDYFQVQIERKIFRDVDVKLAVHAFFGIFLNFVFTQDLLNGKNILLFPDEGRVAKLVDLFLQGVKNPGE